MNLETNGSAPAVVEVHDEPPARMLVMRTAYGDQFAGMVTSTEIHCPRKGCKVVEIKLKWFVKVELIRDSDQSLTRVTLSSCTDLSKTYRVLSFKKPHGLIELNCDHAKMLIRGNKTSVGLTPLLNDHKGEVWELWFGGRARKLLRMIREYGSRHLIGGL